MVELAFYPAVALMYFFGVMRATQDDRVELDDRASLNVFCLFVLAQPLCLVFGGYSGMATYLLTALVSYNFLPWRQTNQPAKGKEAKKKTKWEQGTYSVRRWDSGFKPVAKEKDIYVKNKRSKCKSFPLWLNKYVATLLNHLTCFEFFTCGKKHLWESTVSRDIWSSSAEEMTHFMIPDGSFFSL